MIRATQCCNADFRYACGCEGPSTRCERGTCGQDVVDEQDVKSSHPFRMCNVENSFNIACTHVRPDAGLRTSVLFFVVPDPSVQEDLTLEPILWQCVRFGCIPV